MGKHGRRRVRVRAPNPYDDSHTGGPVQYASTVQRMGDMALEREQRQERFGRDLVGKFFLLFCSRLSPSRSRLGLDKRTLDALSAMQSGPSDGTHQGDPEGGTQELMDLDLAGDGGDESGYETVEEAGAGGEEMERNEIDVRDLLHIRCALASSLLCFFSSAHRHHQYRKYSDGRSWGDRVRRLDANWQAIMPRVIKAFVRWRYSHPPNASCSSPSQVS